MFIVAIAVSLSMDAFSLALSIGTLKFPKKIVFGLASLVGIFHFVMPMIGTFLSTIFVRSIHVDVHMLSGIIFLYIAILMFKDFKKEDEVFKLSILGALLFAIGVSLDSLCVGFALQLDWISGIRSFLIFSIFSAGFTYLGLSLGGVLNSLVGEYSVLVGAAIMAILGILNFCQFLF